MNRARLHEEVKKAIDRYTEDDFWVPRVNDRDLKSFRLEYEGYNFDHEVVLSDGSTVFVMFGPRREKGRIFIAWRFDRDGQFVDYVERSHPPIGVGNYGWIAEVCERITHG